MPIHRRSDIHGSFYQWGNQKKYYYATGSKRSRDIAYEKCRKQSVAILISEGRNKK